MQVLTLVLKLVLSTALGSVIGYEREKVKKPAGLRTMMMVGLGACLFMLISIETARSLHNVDPARIAAQVVTGIGFLGAGAIIRSGETVRGLTTAASIWVVAAIGLAVGIGMYVAAITTTILGYIILWLVEKYFEKRLDNHEG